MGGKLPSSSSLSWSFKGEIFEWGREVWSVDRAKRIIKERPRPIRQLNIEPFRELLGVPGMVRFFGIRINWNKAQSDAVNLDDPLLVAYGKDGRFPIDGWHRIAKALMKGLKTLPYVGLTKEESKQVYRYTGRRRRRRTNGRNKYP